MREHLTEALKTNPAVLADLVGPPLPLEADAAWQAFADLSGTRAVGMHGASRLSYTEIEAYNRLTDAGLTPFDLALLRVADDAFLEDIADRSPSTSSPDP